MLGGVVTLLVLVSYDAMLLTEELSDSSVGLKS